MNRNVIPNLDVTFAGIEFKSPLGVGAVGRPFGKNLSPELHADILLRHVAAGAAYIEIPSCRYTTEETKRKVNDRAKPLKRPNLPPRIFRAIKATTPHKPYGVEGIYTANITWIDIESEEDNKQYIENLLSIVKKRKPQDIRIIANVAGYSDLADSYVDGAKRWEYLGADLIELNLSCPAQCAMEDAVEEFIEESFSERWQGGVIGEIPDIVVNITKEVAKAVKIPVGVKLSPEMGLLRVVALTKRLADVGAKWVQSLNCGITVAPPDIYNLGKPLWPFTNGNPFVGTAGSWLRRDCYKHVAGIGKFVPGIDIAASGGLVLPEHCIEVMMLGAKQIQLCTSVLEKGNNFIKQCDKFIRKYMSENGFNSLDEIIGLGQQYIKYIEDVNMSPEEYISLTDKAKCTNCGVCADNFCVARYMENGIVKLKTEHCNGCGACMIGCPADAIKLIPVSS